MNVDGQRVRAAAGVVWDAFMAALAVLSVAMVLWFDTGNLSARQVQLLIYIDFVVVAIFLADWLFWLRRAQDRKAYLKRTWWDLLGMVPLYFSSVGFLRFLRLLRLFRILRALRQVGHFIKSTEEIAKSSGLIRLGIIAGSVTVVGATLVWLVEQHRLDSGIHQFPEALWWAIVTVTTVGYGDVTPVTYTGRAIAAVLMVTGIGTIGMFASGVSNALITRQRRADQEAHEAQKGQLDAATKIEQAATLPAQLATLAQLHEDGHLTAEEFSAAKQRVLAPP